MNILSFYSHVSIEEMRPVGFHKNRKTAIEQLCQKVAQDSGWKSVESCPGCSSICKTKIMQKCGIDIFQCEHCTLGYTGKIPENISNVYSDQSYLKQAKHDYEQNINYRMERFAPERLSILRHWSGRQLEDSHLLDIGCGTGWFLEAVGRQGCSSISGQELSQFLAAYTAERLGIKIWSCPIEEIISDRLFDVITMFDVLEHANDPGLMLHHVQRLLTPGGIALIFVPHLDSLGFSVLREESALVSPVEHLLYFTKKSLIFLIEKIGLELLHIETKGMDIPDIIAYYRDDRKNMEVVNFFLETGDYFQAVIDEAGRANHLRAVLRKPV